MAANLKLRFDQERRKLETQEAERAARVQALQAELEAERTRLQETRVRLAYVSELITRFGIDRLGEEQDTDPNGREPRAGRQTTRTTARELIRRFVEDTSHFTADDVIAHVQKTLADRQPDSIKAELGYWRRQGYATLDERTGIYRSLR